eukprot:g39752.t1
MTNQDSVKCVWRDGKGRWEDVSMERGGNNKCHDYRHEEDSSRSRLADFTSHSDCAHWQDTLLHIGDRSGPAAGQVDGRKSASTHLDNKADGCIIHKGPQLFEIPREPTSGWVERTKARWSWEVLCALPDSAILCKVR